MAAVVAKYGTGLAWDSVTRTPPSAAAPRRAAQLRSAVETLGAAWIKIFQAVSTRADVLPPAYLAEVERLQDRVKPFDTDGARAEMAAAWGVSSPDAVLTFLSPAPVAAASLGQVYRATLAPRYGGGDVAVKVQRPGVRASVSRDLVLMRAAAAAFEARPGRAPSQQTDWVGVIDEWGSRFTDELDYRREAATAAVVRAPAGPRGRRRRAQSLP